MKDIKYHLVFDSPVINKLVSYERYVCEIATYSSAQIVYRFNNFNIVRRHVYIWLTTRPFQRKTKTRWKNLFLIQATTIINSIHRRGHIVTCQLDIIYEYEKRRFSINISNFRYQTICLTFIYWTGHVSRLFQKGVSH